MTAESVVDVNRPGSLLLPVDQAWETIRDRLHLDPDDDAFDAREFVLRSPKVAVSPEVAAYAAESFLPGRALTEALVDLTARIHRDFTYEPGSTSVRTTLTELLECRQGVCQDFAHLAVGCLRSVGLAGRYVSGYLETVPAPGTARLVGADVSHAWASVFVPDAGWVDLDPTNNRLIDDHFVKIAMGRDYRDVSPVRGIYKGPSDSVLRVNVAVQSLAPQQ